MKFKVGDKVRCIREVKSMGAYVKSGEILTVKEGYLLSCFTAVEREGEFFQNDFELAEQPKQPEWFKLAEPQDGDVWANADKSEVVKIVGEFINFGFTRCFTVVYLKGIKKGRGEPITDYHFGNDFPILLQRKPKKQPKPVAETPKKQEEKWKPVIEPGINPRECFRKGNKIKWITHGIYEGIATCNKKDEFNLQFGLDLAWHRAHIKYHEARIAKMLKEDAKR